MRFNKEFILGIAYIAIMVGITIGQVGEMPGEPEPYSWWLPIGIGFICGVPFWLGYLAGKSDQ